MISSKIFYWSYPKSSCTAHLQWQYVTHSCPDIYSHMIEISGYGRSLVMYIEFLQILLVHFVLDALPRIFEVIFSRSCFSFDSLYLAAINQRRMRSCCASLFSLSSKRSPAKALCDSTISPSFAVPSKLPS